MQLYCPNCQAAFAAAGRCPKCDGRLVTPAEAFESAADLSGLPPEPMRPTAVARVMVGSVVALGLYMGFREWATAGFEAASTTDPWGQPGGLALAVALRLVAILVGAAVAGAGRPAGAGTGVIVGLVCASAAAGADLLGGATLGPTDAGVFAGLTAAAAAAGWVGCRVWPPAIELPTPASRSHGSSILHLARDDERNRAPRPTNWTRVVVAAMMVLTAVLVADSVRTFAKRNSAGFLQMGGPAQAPYVCLEICAVLLVISVTPMLGGTGAGLRHGIFTGALAGLGVAGLTVAGVPPVWPVTEGLLRTFELPVDDLASGPAAAAMFAATMVGCCISGWLSGTLLPPVVAPRPRSRPGGQE